MTPMPAPVRLPEVHPFLGNDVWNMLSGQAERFPDRVLMTWHPFDSEPQQWTYAEFLDECMSVAAGLEERGIGSGDRVVIHMLNCPEFLFTWFGCAAIHAIAVTTNARSSEDELAYYITDCGARAAVTQPAFSKVVRSAGAHLEWIATTETDGPEGFEALKSPGGALVPARPDPAAPLNIQYTSGTTSRPKGVLWTHANGLWSARINSSHEGLRSSDVHLTYMPLFHANAMGFSVLASIWVGASFVLLPKWSSSRFWDISLQHGCTWASLMALSARAILASDVPPKHSYRGFGGPAENPIFEEKFGVQAISWWGMTETIAQVIYSDGHGSEYVGNIGRVAPEYEIAVRDPLGQSTPVGVTGELFVKGVRGLSLFAEYWNNPAATAKAFDQDGWMQTGDLVALNGDGTVSFVDRAKDMLRVGAENVAASEIERVVQTVVGLAEIAVVGIPHEALDEVPVVFVVHPDPPADLGERIIGECSRQLADFKVPREVHFVSALPHSTISKVNKVELRTVLKSEEPLDEAQRRWARASATDPSGDASALQTDHVR